MINKIATVSLTLCCLFCNHTVLAMNEAEKEKAKFISDVIEKGDQDIKDQLLHIYSSFGEIEPIQQLVKSGANVNRTIEDILKNRGGNAGNRIIGVGYHGYTGGIVAIHEKYFTPLHWAANYGHINIVEYLVKNQANINGGIEHDQLTEYESTPLLRAFWCDHPEIVKFLIANRAKVCEEIFNYNTKERPELIDLITKVKKWIQERKEANE